MIKFFATLLGFGIGAIIFQRIMLLLGLRNVQIAKEQDEKIAALRPQIIEQEKKLNDALKEYEDAKKPNSDNS